MVSFSESGVKDVKKGQFSKNEKRLSRKRKHGQLSNLPEIDDNPDGTRKPMVEIDDGASTNSRKRKRVKAGGAKEQQGICESTATRHVTEHELKLLADTEAPKVGIKESNGNRPSKGSKNETRAASAALKIEGNDKAAPAGRGRVKDTSISHRRDGSSPKFIVFIGNLPFTATTESVTKHFAKLKPVSVRHRTHKETGRSKGFAFLEFDGYDRMKTCLKLYHHSDFNDGISPARQINVELTAGGGGSKSEERRSKLKTKNEKLNEQRKRMVLEEKNTKREKAKKAAGDGDDVHPSRRGRVPSS
ncbi:MAG: hypothetical protein M1836_003555 [Candelina mexicana]|nr:MAG: hypothetical protein M1836_003555 [Candelina mexicana]